MVGLCRADRPYQRLAVGCRRHLPSGEENLDTQLGSVQRRLVLSDSRWILSGHGRVESPGMGIFHDGRGDEFDRRLPHRPFVRVVHPKRATTTLRKQLVHIRWKTL